MEKTAERDNKFLGTEKIGKLIRMFAIPCVLSLIIQALYNIVDQLYIGNSYLGDLGNTATGIIYPLTVVALAVGLLLGDGASACMSINQGKNQTKDTHKAVGSCLTVGLISSVILLIVAFFIRGPFVKIFTGEESLVYEYSIEYSTWIIIGFPFFIIATIMNSIIRADGSPKFAMFAMVIGAVVNIVLDPLFIFGFNMGMTGAALATCIAQIISFAVSVAYFFKSKTFRLKIKSFFVNFKLLWTCSKLGVSSFLTQIAIAVVSIVNNSLLASYLPADQSAIGLLTVAFKVFGIIISIVVGIAVGGQPIIGYNYGAGKFDRVRQTFKIIMISTLIVGLVPTILFQVCPQVFIQMFGLGVTDFGVNCFRIYLGFILFTCVTKAISIFFQSIGMPVKATLVTMCRDLIFLVPIAIVLPIFGGIDLFLWSAPISDVLTLVMAMGFAIYTFKKVLKVSQKVKDEDLPKIKDSREGIVITIAREHGAGGREIGQKLAKRLNIPFYDKEVASLMAQESGLATEFIENIEEKQSMLYTLYLSTEANATAMFAQQKVLKKIAEKGSCVIVGRAADYVLKDFNICKVFVFADDEFKVNRVMKNYGDDEKQAKENIEKSDKRRAKFYNAVTGQDWKNKRNYDLCVNSSVGIDETVDVIFNFVKNIERTAH